MQRAALLSVSNREGLVEFASSLAAQGFVLLATSGTLKILNEHSVKAVSIEDYTGQKEILDGRVKTLHPKIHAGILARRDSPEHMAELEREGILPIDVVAVNLYPFLSHLSGPNREIPAKMIELIDIGGPTMIRAAAKNFSSVVPVIDPADYPHVAQAIKDTGAVTLDVRRELAVKVFQNIAAYDLAIASYFSNVQFPSDATASGTVKTDTDFLLGPVSGVVLRQEQSLRYGENPQQRAAYYRPLHESVQLWKQLQGKELSYNNLLDFNAALRLIKAFRRQEPVVAILKHTNPCGLARSKSVAQAVKDAKRCDPRSHFGGILAFNTRVTGDAAQDIAEDFAEIVVAPDYEPVALEILAKKKNLRVLQVNLDIEASLEMRSIEGGVLVQECDNSVSDVREAKIMTGRKPSEQEFADLQTAWTVCAHVKSNAIVILREGMLVGVGAGQMSRIDSTELALSKARHHGHNLRGAVAASDAFFPFRDSLDALANEGVTAIVVPSGSKADETVVKAAEERGISLLFVQDRHFRH